MLESAQISVTTSATQLADAEGDGQVVYLSNKGAAAVFLGPSTVTAANGYELLNATRERIELSPGEALFGIAAAAPQTVHVLRTNAG